MNFVPYAVPVFLLLILVELCWGWLKGNNTYRVNDSINSLSMGLLSTVTKLVFLNIGLLVFSRIEQSYGVWAFDMASLGHWLLGILLYDFLYYWHHRISHERQLFWASHVVHHQSEDYNLSTALRQTSTSFLTTWVFYIPCFLLGMPIYMYVSIATAHLVYQFWVHTQHIPKLGFLEWFMITPSNHRVHHAQNPEYIDKNYGGLLIVWDRLFGTFKEESEQVKPIYGIRSPLSSWNPIWANLHIFFGMVRDAWHTQAWRDKCRVVWSKTDWRPADMAARYPQAKADLAKFEKYNPALSTRIHGAVVAQYILLSFFHFWSAENATQLSLPLLWMAVMAQGYILVVVGAVLDRKPYARQLEYLRLFLLTSMLYGSFSIGLLSVDWLYYGVAYLAASTALIWVCVKSESMGETVASSDLA
ncbi:MAG: sterol desaturase family protein [Porticoccaceae bacterium]|nr:sterol desaturase family protein [Porticoccaceae bacterium]